MAHEPIEPSDKFLQMGKTWFASDKDMNDDDKLALLGHDGATLAGLKKTGRAKWKWAFRYLLTGSVSEKLSTVDEWKTQHEHASPFELVGTRRTSAGLAALDPDVDAVIVMSQDGEIVFWYKLNGGKNPVCLRFSRDLREPKELEVDLEHA